MKIKKLILILIISLVLTGSVQANNVVYSYMYGKITSTLPQSIQQALGIVSNPDNLIIGKILEDPNFAKYTKAINAINKFNSNYKQLTDKMYKNSPKNKKICFSNFKDNINRI